LKKDVLIFGIGYVGLSLAVMLARKNSVHIVDVNKDKVEKVNNKISPISDKDISEVLKDEIDLTASVKIPSRSKKPDYVIIAVPTNYDPDIKNFDTSILDSVIKSVIEKFGEVYIVVKSTIPVGYIDSLQTQYKSKYIVFSPEFLREGSALYDNFYPSRIIIGDDSENAISFCEMISTATKNKQNKFIFTSSMEAESIKLFANTYLAMRVAFFNELDTFAFTKQLDARQIIDGICSDTRIGHHYNNPSFGYGGYCLPKDTMQLESNYQDIPQALISATIKSNEIRKSFISDQIIKMNVETVGVYRLSMKMNSDNSRSSSVNDIISHLISKNINVLVYEPLIENIELNDINFTIVNDIESFKDLSEIIITNRLYDELHDVEEKIFTRDIFKLN
jgi:UDPglucose 6-dehydrogenase